MGLAVHTVNLFTDGLLHHLHDVLLCDFLLLGRKDALGAEHIVPLSVLVRILREMQTLSSSHSQGNDF